MHVLLLTKVKIILLKSYKLLYLTFFKIGFITIGLKYLNVMQKNTEYFNNNTNNILFVLIFSIIAFDVFGIILISKNSKIIKNNLFLLAISGIYNLGLFFINTPNIRTICFLFAVWFLGVCYFVWKN